MRHLLIKLSAPAIIILALLANSAFSQTSSKVRSVNFCQLFDSVEYNGQTVRTKVIVYFAANKNEWIHGWPIYLYSSECNNRDHFAEPNFGQSKNPGWITEIADSIPERSPARFYSATIEGKI